MGFHDGFGQEVMSVEQFDKVFRLGFHLAAPPGVHAVLQIDVRHLIEIGMAASCIDEPAAGRHDSAVEKLAALVEVSVPHAHIAGMERQDRPSGPLVHRQRQGMALPVRPSLDVRILGLHGACQTDCCQADIGVPGRKAPEAVYLMEPTRVLSPDRMPTQ